MLQKLEPGKGSVVIPANLTEASKQHGYIGKLLAKIISVTVKFNKRIAELIAERDVRVSELTAEALLFARGEEIYLTEHQGQLLGNRSTVTLPEGGSVEWRVSPLKVEYEDEKRAVAQLEKLGLQDCINYRPTVYKNKLKDAVDKNLKLEKKLTEFDFDKGIVLRMRFNACKTQIKRNTDNPESELHLHTPAERSQTQSVSA